MDNKLQELSSEREKVYGPPKASHGNIGLTWTAAIQQHYGIELDHPIPAFLVAMMMGHLKIQRATRVFHKDNFDDLHVYGHFAEDFQPKPPEPIRSKRGNL